MNDDRIYQHEPVLRSMVKTAVLIAFAAAIVLALLLLNGCATPYQQMSAEQISAAVKDKNAALVCGQLTGTGGQGAFVTINADKGSLPPNSHIVVKPGENCSVQIDTTQTTKP